VSGFAAAAGAWAVRVHDVASTVNALAVAEAWGGSADQGDSSPIAYRAAGERRRGAGPSGTLVGDVRAEDVRAGKRAAEGRLPQDRIALTGLEVFAHHGVFGFERERGQRFIIDIEIAVDLRAAAAGDALAHTVHYGELAEAAVAAVERDPVDLIETVAERVARVALDFDGVQEARITVHKPDAPIEAEFADVAVTVVRRASSTSAPPTRAGGPTSEEAS